MEQFLSVFVKDLIRVMQAFRKYLLPLLPAKKLLDSAGEIDIKVNPTSLPSQLFFQSLSQKDRQALANNPDRFLA